MPELRLATLVATRISARAEALDRAAWPDGATVLRLAPDDALVLGAAPEELALDDPDAVAVEDAGFAGAWLDDLDAVARHCEWPLPAQRPAFAQGGVAGLPARLWLEDARALLLVPAPYAAELRERLG